MHIGDALLNCGVLAESVIHLLPKAWGGHLGKAFWLTLLQPSCIKMFLSKLVCSKWSVLFCEHAVCASWLRQSGMVFWPLKRCSSVWIQDLELRLVGSVFNRIILLSPFHARYSLRGKWKLNGWFYRLPFFPSLPNLASKLVTLEVDKSITERIELFDISCLKVQSCIFCIYILENMKSIETLAFFPVPIVATCHFRTRLFDLWSL